MENLVTHEQVLSEIGLLIKELDDFPRPLPKSRLDTSQSQVSTDVNRKNVHYCPKLIKS